MSLINKQLIQHSIQKGFQHNKAGKLNPLLLSFLIFFLLFGSKTKAQEIEFGTVNGKVRSSEGGRVPFASVGLSDGSAGTIADSVGQFKLRVKAGRAVEIIVRQLGFEESRIPVNLKKGESKSITVTLTPNIKEEQEVEVVGEDRNRDKVSTFSLKPKDIANLPSAFGDFNMILATLPGVVSNNELSSQYSVRGGSFDENLIYVNDIEIYRPFLVRSGQQEGLSFVNPDLVSQVDFSSGGWQPRFGDKLSSVLNVQYKTPTKFGGRINAGILNQSVSVEGASGDKRFSFVGGLRRKSSEYLFSNSFLTRGLPVQGTYLPQFIDGQAYMEYDFTKDRDPAKPKKTTLGLLLSYSNNYYLVRPATQETDFGTATAQFRFTAAFLGQEVLTYDTYQGGLKFSHRFNDQWRSEVTVSATSTRERERIDVEGGYRLCDVQNDPGRDQFNQCIFTRGIGTFFTYGRNSLDAIILNSLSRNYFKLNSQHKFEFGGSVGSESIQDRLQEYSFIDSADYIKVSPLISSFNQVNSYRLQGYAQHTYYPTAKLSITYGFRLNYWSLNNQLIFSPRAQAAYSVDDKDQWVLRAAIGHYAQPGFYRELRDNNGNVNRGLRAQQSVHYIIGSDYNFKMWDRPFKLTAEGYHKNIWDAVAYDQENVRLRYFANNNTIAYATGADFRLSGEFVNGEESWFSLGILQTRELVENNSVGFTRRPTDQLITASVFFQDHIPGVPSAKVFLNGIVGTGLPFGPPNVLESRGALNAPAYRRVDIGFSKVYLLDNQGLVGSTFDNISVGLEVLNLLGVDNTLSYLWIKDVFNTQFAIPQTLSARFFNLRIVAVIR